ncbi:MAG: TonB-dependent receptor, partial [Aquincola sp.]|nr:TonB-dependent receptor [Aquincola sp.]
MNSSPNPSAQQGQVHTEVFVNGDHWGRWRVGVDANIPLGPQRQGLRLIAVNGKNDSHFRNEPATDYRVFSVSGTWVPVPSLIIDAAVDAVRESSPQSYYLSDINGDYSRLPRIDPRQSYGAPWSRSNRAVRRGTLKATGFLNDDWAVELNLRSDRTDYRVTDLYYFFGADLATGAADTVAYLNDGDKVNVSVADVAVKGEFETGSVRHLLTVGASRYDWKGRFNIGPQGAYFGDVGPNNIYDWVAPPRPDPASLGEPTPREDATRKDTSLFFQARSTFAERYDLWLGARRSRYDTTVSGGGISDRPAVDRFTTPIVSLAWRPNRAHTLYVTSAESVTPGVVVNRSYENRGEIIPPLKVRQAELGWKWRTAAYGLSAALFKIDDRRIVDVPLDDGGERFEQRADGLNRYRGVELNAQWRTGPWRLDGGFVLLDAQVLASEDPALNGTRASGVARRTAQVGVEYAAPW